MAEPCHEHNPDEQRVGAGVDRLAHEPRVVVGPDDVDRPDDHHPPPPRAHPHCLPYGHPRGQEKDDGDPAEAASCRTGNRKGGDSAGDATPSPAPPAPPHAPNATSNQLQPSTTSHLRPWLSAAKLAAALTSGCDGLDQRTLDPRAYFGPDCTTTLVASELLPSSSCGSTGTAIAIARTTYRCGTGRRGSVSVTVSHAATPDDGNTGPDVDREFDSDAPEPEPARGEAGHEPTASGGGGGGGGGGGEGDLTGDVLWPSALLLVEWLASQQARLDQCTVLELGAGCGFCGVAAALLGARRTARQLSHDHFWPVSRALPRAPAPCDMPYLVPMDSDRCWQSDGLSD